MHLLTLEMKFGAALTKAIEKNRPGHETAQALVENPHLWPFFLYPGTGEFALPLGKVESPHVEARVYRGRWLTDCPFCGSAVEAAETDRWFFCADCKNNTAGNRSLPVIWPEDAEAIEVVLLRRPFMESRNWFPYETVQSLQVENDHFMGDVGGLVGA